MAQDFWSASGYALLRHTPEGLVATDAWLATFLAREELAPPPEAGPRERALHARLVDDPRAGVDESALAAVEDADARENWRHFLRFRERVLAAPTLEACYRGLFAEASVPVAPDFVDALARVIVRAALDGTADAFACRAGELFFRRQRVATEDGRVLSADAHTIALFEQTGGFGNVGRLLRQQNTQVAPVKMDVLTAENAPLYFLRDELYSFVLDLEAGGRGATALARVLEAWIARLAGAAVTIRPLRAVEDARWRWHVGLDVDATAILNALYRGESVEAGDLERLLLLFRLEFRDPADALEEMADRPVYLGLACRPDRTLKLKPQNLLTSLPLRASAAAGRG